MVAPSQDQRQKFIHQYTAIASPSLVPEIKLHLATEVTPLWQANAALLQVDNIDPPYWAFAWPGGQAVGRYILDHPETVRGKSVFDFGSGSGLGAIAAAMAGAASSISNDLDPLAATVMAMNAALNNAAILIDQRDRLNQTLDADIILVGDMCYERGSAEMILHWLRRLARDHYVLLADPGRMYAPTDGLKELKRYDVPTSLELEDRSMRPTTVWRLLA